MKFLWVLKLLKIFSIDYFTLGDWKDLLPYLPFSADMQNRYTLNIRFMYGFPVSIDEYSVSMKQLVLSLKKIQ